MTALSRRGLAFYLDDWTGSVTLDGSFVITPSTVDSVFDVAAAVAASGVANVDPSFDWSISSSGRLQFDCDVVFAMTFAGTAGTKLGFTSGPWTGASSYTADVLGSGVWVPFADHALSVYDDVGQVSRPGVRSYDAAAMSHCPGLAWRRPTLQAEGPRSVVFSFEDARSAAGTPLRVSICDESYGLTTYHAGRHRVRTQDRHSHWSLISLEVAR